MPIIDYSLRPNNWELMSNLTQRDIFIFRQFIFDAKKEFDYKNDKDLLKTISPNTDYTKPYIYEFDSSLAVPYDNTYIPKLQNLIEKANKIMYDQVKELKKYKFDILGTWDRGYIIVMRDKKEKDFEDVARKALIKRYQSAGWIPNNSFINSLYK
jgi:hypothetical protein